MNLKLSREEQKDETREKIITSAIDTFVEKGYAGAQMKDIYEKAGIGKKTLYRYFSSKEDLALTTETRILKSIVENIWPVDEIENDTTLNAFEKLKKIYTKLMLDFIYNNEKLFKFTAQFDVNVTGIHDELESGRNFTRYIQSLGDFTEKLIIEGQRDGSVRSDINPSRTSVTGNNAIMGLALRIFAREENIKREQGYGREMIGYQIEMFLDYIKAR